MNRRFRTLHVASRSVLASIDVVSSLAIDTSLTRVFIFLDLHSGFHNSDLDPLDSDSVV